MPRLSAKKLVKSWSYSRYQDHHICPQRFKFKHIDKVPEPKSQAMARGGELHDQLEAFVMKHRTTIPKELVAAMKPLMTPELKRLQKAGAIPEQQLGLTDKWKLTGWFADDTWLRVVMDLAMFDEKTSIARVIDYKTGKINEANHAEQLELYVPAALARFPQAKEIVAEPWYVDHGHIGAPLIYKASDVPRIIKKWNKAVQPMMNETKFVPKPGPHCKWCPFSMRGGGPCKVG